MIIYHKHSAQTFTLYYYGVCAGGQHHVQHLVRGHAGGGPDRVLPARGDHARGGALRWVGDADHSGHSHDGQESYSGNTSRVTPVTSQELNFMEKFGKKIFSK